MQTRETPTKIDELLARDGTDKSKLLTAEVWIASMADFAAIDTVWREWVAPGNPPTHCCGAVELGTPEMRVEIVITAAFGEGKQIQYEP